ncbi:SGNH/GDSL hydrolase family protein [Leucobacter massiliensis]|uniref:SGNH hydrolase n=1 Tax=Leucobacter massiliensis TaxID=1686285 RepID=A0A2S9QQ67_9MICO|nr:SGNH/GDSL hydrolase family protein [Leucobacter massiliensis]PRI11725.1 SGNH hydrolase [Leucobacter massiliensis]
MAEDRIELPWSRFVAIGDSFTEGVGDPDADSPGGLRGWADRFAEVLSELDDDFAYANLAVRGKLIQQIADEQVEAALNLRPDLISVCAGGNDVIRPGTDPDEVAARLDRIVERLSESGATILLFTGVDTNFQPVFRTIRGKVAIFNENVRKVAKRYDCVVVDQWALEELQDSRYWAGDRLHLNALGHHTIARAALDALNIPHELTPLDPPPLPVRNWRQARQEDVVWAREHLVPWVIRRIKHVSSGDHVVAKRPEPASARRSWHTSESAGQALPPEGASE